MLQRWKKFPLFVTSRPRYPTREGQISGLRGAERPGSHSLYVRYVQHLVPALINEPQM